MPPQAVYVPPWRRPVEGVPVVAGDLLAALDGAEGGDGADQAEAGVDGVGVAGAGGERVANLIKRGNKDKTITIRNYVFPTYLMT